MSVRKIAMVWPLDGGPIDSRGRPGYEVHVQEAMISPHIYYAQERGAVYFDRNFEVSEEKRKMVPMTGYIYIGRNVLDVPPARLGTISYRCTVLKILTREELLKDPTEQKYVPPWTRQCLHGKWGDGTPHDPSETWIKVTNIEMLSRGYSPRELGINRDYVRGVVYVEDKDWR
jgi:hypothetical protein